MILQEEQIVIRLGDNVIFWSHPPETTRDPNGSPNHYLQHLRLDDVAIDGWYDGVSVRRTEQPRTTSHGDFKTTATLSSRVITLTGTAVGSSRRNLQNLRDDLMAELNDGGYKTLEVWTRTTGYRYIEVGLEGKPNWVRKTDTFATFKIEFFAPDPHIYGPPLTWTMPGLGFNGGMSFPITYPLYYGVDDPFELFNIENDGNAKAWPVIKVFGEMPDGFKITDGQGNWVVFEGPVGHNSPVTLDFAKGTAKQNNRIKTSYLSRRDWFACLPGEGRQPQPRLSYIGQGLGWMEVTIRDTWI